MNHDALIAFGFASTVKSCIISPSSETGVTLTASDHGPGPTLLIAIMRNVASTPFAIHGESAAGHSSSASSVNPSPSLSTPSS